MVEGMKIRPVREGDEQRVCDIWLKGLDQTLPTLIWAPSFLVRPLGHMLFGSLIKENFDENGAFGPGGKNIVKNWSREDRRLFVACKEDEKPIALCGVVLGESESKVAESAEERKIASIWRLSVEESYRRHGIAEKLMIECENWAKEKKCETMTLVTINQIAHKFYTKKMKYDAQAITMPGGTSSWFGYILAPYLRRYRKSLR